MAGLLDVLKGLNAGVSSGLNAVVSAPKKIVQSSPSPVLANLTKIALEKQKKEAEDKLKVQALIDAQTKNISTSPLRSIDPSMTPANMQTGARMTEEEMAASQRERDLNMIKGENNPNNPLDNLLNTLLKTQVANRVAVGPIANFMRERQASSEKQAMRPTTSFMDKVGDVAKGVGDTAALGFNALPPVAAYNAMAGLGEMSSATRPLVKASDAVTQGFAGAINAIPQAGLNMLPISQSVKEDLSTPLSVLTNLVALKAGSKLGEKAQVRINDAGYRAELMNSLNKNLAREGATFNSGPNFSPIIKALVDAEKKIAKNPVVQALDPTGITTGLGAKSSSKLPPHLQEIADRFNSSVQKGNVSIEDVTPKGYGVAAENVGRQKLEILKGENVDSAMARKVGYQIENGVASLIETPSGWKGTINGLGDNDKSIIRGMNKETVIQEMFKKLYPEVDTFGEKKAMAGEPPIPPVPPKEKMNMGSSEDMPSREAVSASLNDRIDSFMQSTAGYSTKTPEAPMKKGIIGALMSPLTKLNDLYTGALRKGQDVLGTTLEQGLSSDNALARNAASTLQGFFRGIAMSPERETKGMQFKGGLDVANKRAYDVTSSLYKLIDGDTKALERVNSVLDPELATKKVTFDELSTKEKQLYGILREGLDIVHDVSYANGNISPELYAQNKGKYTPRVYDTFELPDEITAALKQSGKKIDVNPYKERSDVDSWKKEHALNDPIYSLGKRLAQVESNRVIKTYADYISNNPKFVSDVEKKGYTKLSDSPAYGELAGKYILNNIAEDFKGFFFAREGLNKWYDAFKSFDSNPIRQGQKKIQTIYNPLTHLGNATSNILFSFLTKVDPLSLTTELASLSKDTARRKQLGDYLTREGILGTSVSRGEFTNQLSEIRKMASGEKKSVLQKIIGVGKNIDDKITGAYGATDDLSKIAAFSALLKKGKSLQEATRLVSDGFQNYNKVGKFYDVYAKTPLVGSAYVKFKGDFLRMLKNAAVNSPMSLVGVLMAFQAGADALSKASGEKPEDKKIREERLGAPYIPLPNGDKIPLTWQTPFGEINVARYVSPMYNYQGTEEDKKNAFGQYASYLPFGNMIDLATQYKSDPAGAAAGTFSDPMLGPLGQALLLDRDFRGKQISDPSANKYQPSTITPQEQQGNILKFLQRSYTPPTLNNIEDLGSNLSGNKDYYGKARSPLQAIAKALGIKVEQFGPEQIQEIRDKTAKYEEAKQNTIQKNITDIVKKVLSGERTEEQGAAQIQQYNDANFDVMKYAEDAKNKILLKKTPRELTPEQQAYTQKKSEFASKKNEMLVQKLKEIAAQGTEQEAEAALKAKYKGLSDMAIKKLISDARN